MQQSAAGARGPLEARGPWHSARPIVQPTEDGGPGLKMYIVGIACNALIHKLGLIQNMDLLRCNNLDDDMKVTILTEISCLCVECSSYSYFLVLEPVVLCNPAVKIQSQPC